MPSIQITISAWWAVAVVAQMVWLFVVVRPLWSFIDGRVRQGDWRAHRRWRKRWEPVAMVVAGPLVWVFWAYESIEQRKVRRANARRRAAREEGE
jgi:hypothetical protein